MAKHPNCEFIKVWVDGSEVEFKYSEDGDWSKVEYLCQLDDDPALFRIKPKTRMINGFEVACAMDKEPEHGDCYFYPSLVAVGLYNKTNYISGWDKNNFQRAICFSNKEDAIAVAKAMLGIDPNS